MADRLGRNALRRFRGDEFGDDSRLPSVPRMLVGVAIVLSLFLLSLPVLEALVISPELRWVFFVGACALIAIAILRIAYPKKDVVFVRGTEADDAASEGPIARMATTISEAERGNRMSQYAAYAEVRRAAIQRMAAKSGISRAEVDRVLSDGERLRMMVRDRRLADFLALDLNRLYLSSSQARNGPGPWSTEFRVRFDSLLKGMEDWK